MIELDFVALLHETEEICMGSVFFEEGEPTLFTPYDSQWSYTAFKLLFRVRNIKQKCLTT